MEIENHSAQENSISYSEIESIIEMALTAPSGDNCQPWRFTWNDNTLAIFYQPQLGQHALNNNNHATWLTLGCLLEAFSISASGLKLRIRETLNFNEYTTKPVAILKFYREEIKTDSLISEIQRRKTIRQPYLDEKLPDSLIQLLKKEADTFLPECAFSFQDEKPTAILSYLYFCDEFMWKNVRVAKDFFKWVRLDDKEISNRQDGMPWLSLGLKKAEVAPFRFFRRFPSLIRFAWKLGFAKQINKMTETLVLSNAGLYSFAIRKTEPLYLQKTGRLAYRIWLLLTSEGYSVQPLSIPSMTAYDVATGFAPPQTDTASLEKFKIGYQNLKSFFTFSDDQYPVWMFRTGRLASSEKSTTPRVNVNERLKVYTRNKS
jgi:transposase